MDFLILCNSVLGRIGYGQVAFIQSQLGHKIHTRPIGRPLRIPIRLYNRINRCKTEGRHRIIVAFMYNNFIQVHVRRRLGGPLLNDRVLIVNIPSHEIHCANVLNFLIWNHNRHKPFTRVAHHNQRIFGIGNWAEESCLTIADRHNCIPFHIIAKNIGYTGVIGRSVLIFPIRGEYKIFGGTAVKIKDPFSAKITLKRLGHRNMHKLVNAIHVHFYNRQKAAVRGNVHGVNIVFIELTTVSKCFD